MRSAIVGVLVAVGLGAIPASAQQSTMPGAKLQSETAAPAVTVAFSSAKLTPASDTPGCWARDRSTRRAQAAQVMPSTGKVTVARSSVPAGAGAGVAMTTSR